MCVDFRHFTDWRMIKLLRQLSNMDFYSTALRFFNKPYVDSDAERAMKVIDINKPISEPFKSKINWSIFLGGNGWVISPFIKLARGVHPWYWAAKRNRQDLIERFFTENNENMLSRTRGYIRENLSSEKFARFMEAEENYSLKHFTSCAMILVSFFESSIRECPIVKWRYKVTSFYKDALKNELMAKDNLSNKFIGQVMLKNDIHSMYLPSLDSFINHLFINGKYSFENCIEPPYMNRNWLMHGMMKREVTKTECIQVFNALFTLLFVRTYLLYDSPFDN